jgi:hypothetical protein
VLEKQTQISDSPGLEMWQSRGLESKARELKVALDKKANGNFLFSDVMKDICKGYIDRFYKEKPDERGGSVLEGK